jgi:hypothetical protein
MLNDSQLEISDEQLKDFIRKSSPILDSLKESLANFKNTSDLQIFETFSTNIEPLSKDAFALSLNDVGDLARFGKELSKKAMKVEEVSKLFSIHGLLAQIVKVLETVFKGYKKGMRPNPDTLEPLLARLFEANKNV